MATPQLLSAVVDFELAREMANSQIMRTLKTRPEVKAMRLDEMFLTAIALDPQARAELEAERDKRWAATVGWADGDPLGYDEVVIGTGPHAAAWANIRKQLGFRRALLIGDTRVGGSFARSVAASFITNSRNRPGPGGQASEGAQLNFVPGAPLQVASFTAAEFPTNADIAFVTRSSIARNAAVRMGTVEGLRLANRENDTSRAWKVMLADGVVYTDRIIDARGLGMPREPSAAVTCDGACVLNFYQLLERFDKPFPLAGWKRVAVVGDGDSSRCAVEALLGLAPVSHFSVPMLDWVEQVDWYGTNLPPDCFSWREAERSRYQRIGGFLQSPRNGIQRLRSFQQRGVVTPGPDDTAYVNGTRYDAVIYCGGFERRELNDGGYFGEDYEVPTDLPFATGKQFYQSELYQVGPAANLPFDGADSEFTRQVVNNRVALFRTLPRTARLAYRLPGTSELFELDRTPPKPEPKRRYFGKDSSGVVIREGDTVRLTTEQNGQIVQGKAVRDNRRYSRSRFAVLPTGGSSATTYSYYSRAYRKYLQPVRPGDYVRRLEELEA